MKNWSKSILKRQAHRNLETEMNTMGKLKEKSSKRKFIKRNQNKMIKMQDKLLAPRANQSKKNIKKITKLQEIKHEKICKIDTYKFHI